MIQLDDLMQKITIDNLEEGTLTYEEKIDYDNLNKELNKEKIGINYWIWKYYCGSISKEGHTECKDWIRKYYDDLISQENKEQRRIEENMAQKLGDLIKIYERIFYEKEIDEEFLKNTRLLEQLWIMRPRDNFQYEDTFNKLIYQVYIKTQEKAETKEQGEGFREIALNYYNENQKERNNQTDKEIFLICADDNSDEHNKKYGIRESEKKD